MAHRLGSVVVALAAAVLQAAPSEASCGCEKPAPLRAAVRPSFAFAASDVYGACDLKQGGCVALFSDQLVDGRTYTVEFRADRDDKVARVKVVARSRRDLADGAWRVQLWTPVPRLKLGPTSIVVTQSSSGPGGSGGSVVLTIPPTDFTVIAPPVTIPPEGGLVVVDGYRMAVGHDGTAYVALDVTGMLPRVDFVSQGWNLPVHFSKDDVLVFNTQGVVMEALSSTVLDEDLNNDGDSNDEGEADWNHNGLLDNPDISGVVRGDAVDSDALFYSRHPFDTYEVEHQPGAAHELDPTDTNWHVDGTRHTDNFHFVVAISGATLHGEPLAPGSTKRFTLAFDAAVAGSATGAGAEETVD
jgi:hypothetical protein